MWNPKNDGVDHINIYSKGNTELGRFLSHFTHSPFMVDGTIWRSMEGFYFYTLVTYACPGLDGMARHRLRRTLAPLWGIKAKGAGRDIVESFKEAGRWVEISPERLQMFDRDIRNANAAKLYHSEWWEMFLNTKLPFTHYYYFGDIHNNPKVVETKSASRLVEGFEYIRKVYNAEQDVVV